MPKNNNGKKSEAEFENCLRTLYKGRVHIIRFDDAAELYGKNGGLVIANNQPADYLVVANGAIFLAEVKSSIKPTSFNLHNIGDDQWKHAKATRFAGGKYIFFIHNPNTDKFYYLDSAEAERTLRSRSSIKWEEMSEWTEYNTYKALKK